MFVYITHDLDFAASRIGATTVWLKEYDGSQWDWELVPAQEGIPEQMLLSVLGSRKKVLLTEGDRSSLDFAIYSRAYPERTVLPMGGCSDVIAATKTLNLMSSVHHLAPAGLIDRDYRDDSSVSVLQRKEVHVLAVHEVEQLLLTEAVIEAVAKSLAIEEYLSIIESIKTFVFNKVENNFDLAAARLAANRIQLALSNLDTGVRNENALKSEFSRLITEAEPTKIYAETSKELRDALDQKDYRAVLRLYSDKGLTKEVANFFNFTGAGYTEHVKRLITKQDNYGIVAAIRGELPTLS